MMPVVMFALGGIMLGGAWSLRGQGASKVAVVVVALLGLLAVAGGVAWLLPKGVFG
jgi:hypothetical protein